MHSIGQVKMDDEESRGCRLIRRAVAQWLVAFSAHASVYHDNQQCPSSRIIKRPSDSTGKRRPALTVTSLYLFLFDFFLLYVMSGRMKRGRAQVSRRRSAAQEGDVGGRRGRRASQATRKSFRSCALALFRHVLRSCACWSTCFIHCVRESLCLIRCTSLMGQLFN